jgi:hypothetical protein
MAVTKQQCSTKSNGVESKLIKVREIFSVSCAKKVATENQSEQTKHLMYFSAATSVPAGS